MGARRGCKIFGEIDVIGWYVETEGTEFNECFKLTNRQEKKTLNGVIYTKRPK